MLYQVLLYFARVKYFQKNNIFLNIWRSCSLKKPQPYLGERAYQFLLLNNIIFKFQCTENDVYSAQNRQIAKFPSLYLAHSHDVIVFFEIIVRMYSTTRAFSQGLHKFTRQCQGCLQMWNTEKFNAAFHSWSWNLSICYSSLCLSMMPILP